MKKVKEQFVVVNLNNMNILDDKILSKSELNNVVESNKLNPNEEIMDLLTYHSKLFCEGYDIGYNEAQKN